MLGDKGGAIGSEREHGCYAQEILSGVPDREIQCHGNNEKTQNLFVLA
jgi:hypothetical protein